MAIGEEGDARPDQHEVPIARDQSLRGEKGEVDRLAEAPLAVGGGDQAEEVGHRTRSDDRGPEPADGGVGRGMAGGVPVEEQGGDPRPRQDGWSGRRGARGWRGIHLDGRTGISTEGPGHRNGHALCDTK